MLPSQCASCGSFSKGWRWNVRADSCAATRPFRRSQLLLSHWRRHELLLPHWRRTEWLPSHWSSKSKSSSTKQRLLTSPSGNRHEDAWKRSVRCEPSTRPLSRPTSAQMQAASVTSLQEASWDSLLQSPDLEPHQQQSLFAELWREAGVQPADVILDIFPQEKGPEIPDTSYRGLFFPGAEAVGLLDATVATGNTPRSPGSVLISVPLQYALKVPVSSPKSGRSTSGKSAVNELAVLLLQNLGCDGSEASARLEDEKVRSFWKKWVTMLPKSIPTAADWTQEEIQELQFPEDIAEVLDASEWEEEQVADVAARTGASKDSARWAIRIVRSRSFTLCIPPSSSMTRPLYSQQSHPPGQEGESLLDRVNSEPVVSSEQWVQAIVPLVDMANHAPSEVPRPGLRFSGGGRRLNDSAPGLATGFSNAVAEPEFSRVANAAWRVASCPPYSGSSAGLPQMQLIARGTIHPGEEVTISYGPHSSLSFLLNFGFFPGPHNPGAKALLYSSLQGIFDDSEVRVRLQMRKEEALSTLVPHEMPFWAQAGGSASMLLDILCFVHAQSREELQNLEDTMRRENSLGFANMSPSTRAVAAQQIHLRTRDCIQSLPTTIEEDLGIVSSSPVHATLRTILHYRISQKILILSCHNKYKVS